MYMYAALFYFTGGDQLCLPPTVEKKEAKLWQMV